MTASELQALLGAAESSTPDIPVSYGNPMTGVWSCSAEKCSCRMVPRGLRILRPHGKPPFRCPLCGNILVYDEVK